MLPVDGVEPVVVEADEVVLGVLAVVPLLEGVQGATVEVVPLLLVLLLPVTLPGLLEFVVLEPGVVVCSVPIEPVVPDPVVLGVVEVVPCGVEVVPLGVEVVPCGVDVVPDGVDVVVVLGVCVPMPVLGVTVPVVCAEATPIASANTDEANRIFRMNLAPSFTSALVDC